MSELDKARELVIEKARRVAYNMDDPAITTMGLRVAVQAYDKLLRESADSNLKKGE